MQQYGRLFYYSTLFYNAPVPEYVRAVYKEIDFTQKMIALTGAKGVGKTTILHQYMKRLDLGKEELLYVSMDNPVVGDTPLLDIAETFHKRGGKVLLVDEIHYQSGFEKDLKAIYDFFDLKVVFSGSSAIALGHADLSRRAVVYTVPVLSFREYLELVEGIPLPAYSLEEIVDDHVSIAAEVIGKLKPLRHFDAYLEHGAYPFFLEGVETFPLKLSEAIGKTIESDLLQIYHIDPRNIATLKKLLLLLCEQPPGELNMSALSRETGINTRTLYNYLTALHHGELIEMVYYSRKGNALFQKPDKILLANPNLFQVLCHSSNTGSLRESFFLAMMQRHHLRYLKKGGDYLVDDRRVFEIGGKGKDFHQIGEEGFLAVADIEMGEGRKIPLWLFGFLY